MKDTSNFLHVGYFEEVSLIIRKSRLWIICALDIFLTDVFRIPEQL